MTPRRPSVVAVDAIETLFSLDPVRVGLGDAGAERRAVELILFNRLLRDGFALAARDVRPFATWLDSRRVVVADAPDENESSVPSPNFACSRAHRCPAAMARLAREGVRM